MTRRLLVVVGLVLALGVVNVGVWRNEAVLTDGRLVLLPLAPVDPRSLMQGDYMALRFEAAVELQRGHRDMLLPDGEVVLRIDDDGVARPVRIATGPAEPLAGDEVRMRYRVRNGRLRFTTDAWFFEEGTAHIYDASRYGGFRIDRSGRALLEGMYDENFERLGG